MAADEVQVLSVDECVDDVGGVNLDDQTTSDAPRKANLIISGPPVASVRPPTAADRYAYEVEEMELDEIMPSPSARRSYGGCGGSGREHGALGDPSPDQPVAVGHEGRNADVPRTPDLPEIGSRREGDGWTSPDDGSMRDQVACTRPEARREPSPGYSSNSDSDGGHFAIPDAPPGGKGVGDKTCAIM